jgi:hypothetical protein
MEKKHKRHERKESLLGEAFEHAPQMHKFSNKEHCNKRIKFHNR